jgi:hypothetical protein
MVNTVRIIAADLHWIDSGIAEEDLCAHGVAWVEVDGETVATAARGSTLSAAALHLLRTLDVDHTPYAPVGGQLVPCCGFTMLPIRDDSPFDTLVLGCPNGLDWAVRHVDAGVELAFEGGTRALVSDEEWRAAVTSFSRTVRAFYGASEPKKMPSLAEEADGYRAFLSEWERRHTAAERSADK